jgi:hypothetical protein
MLNASTLYVNLSWSLDPTIVGAIIGAAATFLAMLLPLYQAKRQADAAKEQAKEAKRQADAAKEQVIEARRQADEAKRQANAAHLAIVQSDLQSAAEFLEAIASALEGMAGEFTNSRIPYGPGHTFLFLIDNYEVRLRPYLSDRDQHDIERFRNLVERAKQMDSTFARDLIPDEALREKLINDLHRAAGDVRGKAATVRLRRSDEASNANLSLPSANAT